MSDSQNPKVLATDAADPAWAVAIWNRKAVLWIGRDAGLEIRNAGQSALSALLVRPWAAVVVDGADVDVDQVVDATPEVDGLPFRVYTANPAAAPPPAH